MNISNAQSVTLQLVNQVSVFHKKALNIAIKFLYPQKKNLSC